MESGASQRLKLLGHISRLFAEAVSDEAELFRAIAEQIAEVTADACTVRLLSDDGEWLEPVAAFHKDPSIRAALASITQQTRQRARAGVWQQVIAAHSTIRISVSPQEIPQEVSAEQANFIRRFRARYFMAMPMIARSRVIGGISLVRFERDTAFSDDDEVFLRELAERAALAIDNARLLTAERTARAQAERGAERVRLELAERQKTEKALEESEAKYRQAQKMEAVGRLAGGIAHDFNNVLSVVLSHCDLLMADLDPESELFNSLREIRTAGERAAGLTRQLLAFSRQQVLEPRVLNINEVVRGIETMLKTIVGEDVELTVRLAPALSLCRVDPGQLEQVLTNLAVNARDAMPHGGKLTIETCNASGIPDYTPIQLDSSPRPYVLLAVSDTGIGMDKATQARIFEPFFTTKPKDKGTGLGLATVYGIVKQSGGNVSVYSEPGVGTTFRVYIPKSTSERVEAPVPVPLPSATGGDETVLLVEDEIQLRRVAHGVLRRAGYNVLEAANGSDALVLHQRTDRRIHLLLTDVVMPRMSGRELAESLRQRQPELKVVFMSGYTEDAVVLHEVLMAGVDYLQKPIIPDKLLRKVRQVLDAGRTS